MPRSDYPTTVVLDPAVRYKHGIKAAVRRGARSRLWQGTIEERKAKFLSLHADLCRVYAKTTTLEFATLDGGCSGRSYYSPAIDKIVIVGRLSVVTYLHEFAHTVFGSSERQACRWSINLFARCFPKSWAKTITDGHMVRRVPF